MSIPPCPHRPPCPACPRYGDRRLPAAATEFLGSLAVSQGLGGYDVLAGDSAGFRHRARLAVRGRVGSPKIGIFQAGSHRIVDIPRCTIHHPLINRVAAALKDSMRSAGLAPYADGPHRGDIRYVQVVVERSSETAQVVVVVNDDVVGVPGGGFMAAHGDLNARLKDCETQLRGTLGDRLHSLWINGNSLRTNTILGSSWAHVCGPEAVREYIGGADVFFPPGAFGQSNLGVADEVVDYVASSVPESTVLAEYYAGVGALGLGLARRGAVAKMNELSPASLEGLRLGICALEPDAAKRISVFEGAAGTRTAMADGADVVLVDPPRKGLDPALLANLDARPPARLIYVSCSLSSFRRDVSALIDSGTYALTRLAAADFFPYTEHVETVAVLDHLVAA